MLKHYVTVQFRKPLSIREIGTATTGMGTWVSIGMHYAQPIYGVAPRCCCSGKLCFGISHNRPVWKRGIRSIAHTASTRSKSLFNDKRCCKSEDITVQPAPTQLYPWPLTSRASSSLTVRTTTHEQQNKRHASGQRCCKPCRIGDATTVENDFLPPVQADNGYRPVQSLVWNMHSLFLGQQILLSTCSCRSRTMYNVLRGLA